MPGALPKDLNPVRVIVAEDEPLIAWMLESTLSAMGLAVIGPFASVDEAAKSLDRYKPHLAVLDVNLEDGEVYPLADQLHAREVPLIFHTANTKGETLKTRYAGAQIVYKPSEATHVQEAVRVAQAHIGVG